MSGRAIGAGRRRNRLVPASLLATVGLGLLAFTLSAGADISAVSGSAYGASGTVTVHDFDSSTPPAPAVLAPAPTVTLPSTGGNISESAPSTSFGARAVRTSPPGC